MGEPVAVAVLVSGGGTNLQALLDAEQAGRIVSGRIRLVVSNRADAYALERARLAGVETVVLTREEYPGTEAFEEKLAEVLQQHGIGLIVLAGFMRILSGNFTARYPKRILNVHPSLIPAFCGKGFYGLRVHQAALDYGVKVTGATVHFVNEVPDGGEILLQKAGPVCRNDTPERLQKRVMERAEWKLLPRGVELVCARLLKESKE